MAYRIDQSGVKSQSPLTAAEIADYKTWAATPFGQSFVSGITDAGQLTAVVNQQRAGDNPEPSASIARASIGKGELQNLATGILLVQRPGRSELAGSPVQPRSELFGDE